MESRIKAAFNSVHASEELKSKTCAFIARNSCNYTLRKLPNRVRIMPVLATAACMAIVFFAGIKLYFTPTTHINIDINPSLDLGINMFDRVVSVDALNDDGEKLIMEMPDIKFAAYDEALRKILDSKSIGALLSEDEIMTVTVIETNSPQSENILSAAKACVSGYGNVHCHSASPEEASAAHKLGLSYEKYLAYLNLLTFDQNITPEQIRNMTMREIRELINITGNGYDDQNNHNDHDDQNSHNDHDNQNSHDDHDDQNSRDDHDDQNSRDDHDDQNSHDDHDVQNSHDNHDYQSTHESYSVPAENGHHGNGHKNGHG